MISDSGERTWRDGKGGCVFRQTGDGAVFADAAYLNALTKALNEALNEIERLGAENRELRASLLRIANGEPWKNEDGVVVFDAQAIAAEALAKLGVA